MRTLATAGSAKILICATGLIIGHDCLLTNDSRFLLLQILIFSAERSESFIQIPVMCFEYSVKRGCLGRRIGSSTGSFCCLPCVLFVFLESLIAKYVRGTWSAQCDFLAIDRSISLKKIGSAETYPIKCSLSSLL